MEKRKFSCARLKDVFVTHGIQSHEFYDEVKYFVWFLLKKYCCTATCDDFNRVFVKIVSSIAYYDNNKNLGTFLHSTIRNECSLINHYRKKESNPLFYRTLECIDKNIIDFDYTIGKNDAFDIFKTLPFVIEVSEFIHKNKHFKKFNHWVEQENARA